MGTMPLRIKISVNDAKPIHPPNWMPVRFRVHTRMQT